MDKRTKELANFIGSLSGWEIKFVEDTIAIARNFRQYIEESKVTVEEFCKQMNIAQKDFNKFVSGNWNYSVNQIASLEYHWTEFRKSKVSKKIIEVVNQEELINKTRQTIKELKGE